MTARRRLVLQLTPLLDLLLIVVFAQYMDLKHTSQRTLASVTARSRSVTEREIALRQRAEAERDDARRVRDNCLKEVTAKSKTIADLRSEQEQLRKGLADAQQASTQAARDLEQIGKLLSELLQVPNEALQKALADLPAQGKQKIRKALEDLRGKDPHSIIRHLRKQEELKKRVDIWEIHIDDRDVLSIRVNGKLIPPDFRIRSADDLRLKMEGRFRAQAEPKSLVLLLLSYSGGATRRIRRDAETGLVSLTRGLRATYEGKKRFEAAVIGMIRASLAPRRVGSRPVRPEGAQP